MQLPPPSMSNHLKPPRSAAFTSNIFRVCYSSLPCHCGLSPAVFNNMPTPRSISAPPFFAAPYKTLLQPDR
jgi:hypothetical protein